MGRSLSTIVYFCKDRKPSTNTILSFLGSYYIHLFSVLRQKILRSRTRFRPGTHTGSWEAGRRVVLSLRYNGGATESRTGTPNEPKDPVTLHPVFTVEPSTYGPPAEHRRFRFGSQFIGPLSDSSGTYPGGRVTSTDFSGYTRVYSGRLDRSLGTLTVFNV